MKIRPLHKNLAGNYESSDRNWLFVGYFLNETAKLREWYVYQRMADDLFHKDTPYFFESYSTLKSIVKALEKANPKAKP